MRRISPTARSVIRDALLVAPGYLIPGVATLIGVPVLFKALGAAQYGLWSLVNAIASGVPPLTTSSVEAMTLRFTHRERGRRRTAEWIFATAISTAAAAVLASLLIPDVQIETIAVTALLSASVSLYLIAIASLHAQLRFGWSSAASSFRALLGMALAVVAAVATGSAAVAVIGLATGFAIAIVGSMVWRVNEVPESTGSPNPAAAGSGRLRYGAASMIVAVGLFVLSVGDRFMLSALSSLAVAGVYAAAYTIEDLVVRLAPSAAQIAVRPRIFQAWDAENSEQVVTATTAMLSVILWVGLTAVSGVIMVGHLLGISAAVLRLLGPIGIGLSASVACTSVGFLYSAAERQWRLAANVAVAAALNIALNLLWIPPLGAEGAALATAIGFVVLLILHLSGYRHELAREPATMGVGLLALAATGVVGIATTSLGGPAWAVVGFIASALLVPLARTSWRKSLGKLF